MLVVIPVLWRSSFKFWRLFVCLFAGLFKFSATGIGIQVPFTPLFSLYLCVSHGQEI